LVAGGIIMMFNIGDRVFMKEPQSKYTAKSGVVIRVNLNTYDITVQFDCNQTGHLVTFPATYFDLVEAAVNTDLPYNVKCARWYKSAYASITKAGGVPDSVIGKIPEGVLDTLIKNDLHLEYKP
jgi:calcineurin-like phosphoesterase